MDTCESPCDSNKQWRWDCVLNHVVKPFNLQGRIASSQGNLKAGWYNILLRLMGSA